MSGAIPVLPLHAFMVCAGTCQSFLQEVLPDIYKQDSETQ